ncbi:aminoglycoside phosphotransferase family protein [Ktedonosporobacter rubrisoli]|uniref:Aminoglycoside phosphotransferase family protein n=1 Tax=Ktedonosporobacter rubrisoli TaxID=2509675 RepID=A0A4P6JI56_KTERU|nr:aminoglycoside phosphotransferase family protein [Ktedonosporobacter rubrisoli]QBD74643.1 aminoglycoside phosphotransferase family protein [Ktedonosporobacter rubrisoli]
MKSPLKDDNALIRAVLWEQWNLEVRGIYFIPIGDSAYSYRLEVEPDQWYYLKVVDRESYAGQRVAAHMNFSLPLQQLVAKQYLAKVSAPLPQATITGTLHALHGPFLFALYTFIQGETLADAYPMTPALIQRIGQALASVHTIQLPEALRHRSPQDSLTAPFEDTLLPDLAALENISAHDAPSLQRLREIVWPRRKYIQAFLAHSQEYARKAQQTPAASVICHGDAWGGNMILSPSGQLTLLDWESAVIAPPERDAFMYMGSDFAAFNTGYRTIHQKPTHWHTSWLAYYAYRIQLRNLAHWLHNILHEPLDEVQRGNDITMIEYHCLDRWEGVERAAQELEARSIDGLI